MNTIISIIVFLIVFVLIKAESEQELWFKFKDEHGKSYNSIEEENLRFDIFCENLVTIQQHNIRYEEGSETYYLGINQFADMTSEEFIEKIYSRGLSQFKETDNVYMEKPDENDLPDAVDWRLRGIVTEIKYSPCGQGWAASATGSLEGQLALKTSKLVPLSVQQLVDCTSRDGTDHCSGGNMEIAFQYVEENGLASEEDYPSNEDYEECYDDSVEPAVQIQYYKFVNGTEDNVKEAVATIGPLSAAVEANTNWQLYAGGVFSGACPGENLNHAILLVGYNSTINEDSEAVDYWIIRNDWGKNWGEDGYIRIARNKDNLCGIADYVLYPIL